MVVLRIEAIIGCRPDEFDQGYQPVNSGPRRLKTAPLVDLGKQLAGGHIDLAHAEGPRVAQLFDFDQDRLTIGSLVSLG